MQAPIAAATTAPTGIPDIGRAQARSIVREAAIAAPADAARLQMDRLATLVHASARRSERAHRCHAGAAQRIDAAIYELEQLRAEIASVLRPSH